MAYETFEQFGLRPEVLAGIHALGWKTPLTIQQDAVPKILAGGDVILQARTGTGKTGAFGIPIVQRVNTGLPAVQALILAPTRELALQVATEVEKLGVPRGVRCLAVYGGDSMQRQIRGLEQGAQIVAGTPGRVLDHLKTGTLSLRRLAVFVLDEADEMLSMGFLREMTQIASFLPAERQTILCSATIPPAVEYLASQYLRSPERIALIEKNRIVPEIRHHWYMVKTMEKLGALMTLLRAERPDSCIIFCNTRDDVRKVTGFLSLQGVAAEMLSGELTQKARERVMGRIKGGDLRIMVATDVAARGIDIQGLSHVFNFRVPETPDVYIHRTGRTGRVGRTGTAISLVGGMDIPHFNLIEKIRGLKIEQADVPDPANAVERRTEEILENLRVRAGLLQPESPKELEMKEPVDPSTTDRGGGTCGCDCKPAGPVEGQSTAVPENVSKEGAPGLPGEVSPARGEIAVPPSLSVERPLLLDTLYGVEPDDEALASRILADPEAARIVRELLKLLRRLEAAAEPERRPQELVKPREPRGFGGGGGGDPKRRPTSRSGPKRREGSRPRR